MERYLRGNGVVRTHRVPGVSLFSDIKLYDFLATAEVYPNRLRINEIKTMRDMSAIVAHLEFRKIPTQYSARELIRVRSYRISLGL